MGRFTVVLVEPHTEGNVGAVARVMANFGLRNLVLVAPSPLGNEALRRAKHAGDILRAASRVENLEEALVDAGLAVGTTGISTNAENRFHRQSIPPWELAAKLSRVDGPITIVLGREDYGLYNEELDRMDLLVTIPAHPNYPILNLSHAAAILLYELYQTETPSEDPSRPLASAFEKEALHDAFREFLETTRYPAHKRRRTEVMFRRLLGRSLPTRWEFHALMGTFRGATKAVRRLSESPGPGPSS